MWIIEFMMMAIEDMKVIVREQAYLLYYYNRLHEAYIWLCIIPDYTNLL
jgi:hypothetical protein